MYSKELRRSGGSGSDPGAQIFSRHVGPRGSRIIVDLLRRCRPDRVLGSQAQIAHTAGVGEPISRWSALLVTLVSLPFACITVTLGLLGQSSSLLEIGLAWVGVLGLLAVVVQVGVALLNHHAARFAPLPRAWAASRKPR